MLCCNYHLSSMAKSLSTYPLGRLTDAELAQCVCNASIGALSTRQLVDISEAVPAGFAPYIIQAWAVERLVGHMDDQGHRIKPVGANERIAELVKLGGESAELLRLYEI